MRTSKTRGRGRAGLTASGIIILQAAKAGPVVMCRPDRRGTRIAGYDEATGAALIVAYSNPETTLVRRGYLRPRNERHTYDITDAGRAAIAKAEHPASEQALTSEGQPSAEGASPQ